ncbi:MAG: hypothetical protein HQ582_25005 [Planctomycetes bacterium]|nr:hypothetical protein [Planctomycetota bacterium]
MVLPLCAPSLIVGETEDLAKGDILDALAPERGLAVPSVVPASERGERLAQRNQPHAIDDDLQRGVISKDD